MNELKEFFDSFQELTNERFVIYNHNFELIYASFVDHDLLVHINHLINKKNNESVFGHDKITCKKFEYSGEQYTLVRCVDNVGLKVYEDPFLQRVSFLFDDVPYSIGVTKDDKIIYRNNFTMNLLGLNHENKDNIPLFESIIEEDRDKMSKAMSNFNGTKEIKIRFIDGRTAFFTFDINEFTYKSGEYKVISARDVTGLKNSEETAVTEREYLNRTLESISEGIIILDFNNRITLFNSVASQLLSYTREQVLYKVINDALVFTDENFQQIDITSKEYASVDGYSITENGLLRNLRLKTSMITDIDGKKMGLVVILTDLSEIKRREEEILYLSYHDVLTGIYNRTYFEEEIRRMDNSRNLPLSIIMGDLNGLKLTNDVFGHHIGDELLRRSSEILKQSLRSNDVLARWGGDEFIILLPNTPEERVHQIMDRISRNFGTAELQISKRGFSPSISLGYGVKLAEMDDIDNVISIAEKNMYKRKMLSKESVYSSAITSMKTVLFEKSNETEEHTNRLYDMCKEIANRYNISKEEHGDLELLCMLHDIGKIGIDDTVLKKPGKLTDTEWVEMKRHSEIGFRIAQAIPELKNVAVLILNHHEKFDGTGYPKQIKGYDIPLLCRILSVGDAYDAMTNDRTYRKAMTHEEAIKEIKANSGTQFDPDVVSVFVKHIQK